MNWGTQVKSNDTRRNSATPVIQVTEPGWRTATSLRANFQWYDETIWNSAALTPTRLLVATPAAGVPAETVTVTDGQWQPARWTGGRSTSITEVITVRTRRVLPWVAQETFTLTQSLAELGRGCDQCRAGRRSRCRWCCGRWLPCFTGVPS